MAIHVQQQGPIPSKAGGGLKTALARLIGVRQAARQLGVHENTLRRWERAGLVRAVRLPSGTRRFRAEDIDRLQQEMYDQVAEDALARAKEQEPIPV
jgi:excisionase family DNA binding protein